MVPSRVHEPAAKDIQMRWDYNSPEWEEEVMVVKEEEEDREAQDVMRDGWWLNWSQSQEQATTLSGDWMPKGEESLAELNGNSSAAAAEEIGLSIADTEL